MQKQEVIPLLIDMANKGYLEYDPENEVGDGATAYAPAHPQQRR
jgi:hypothetical protein